MRSLQSLLRRLRSLLEKDSRNAELSEELRFHLERQTEENIANGMNPGQARAEAKADFGGLVQATEECYQARSVSWIADFGQDVHYGLRALSKHRSFTFVAVLTLALGIGACTAIFSLVNAVLIRSLPYGDSGKLVYLFTPNPHLGIPAEAAGPRNADFFDLKKQSHSFAEMTLFEQASYSVTADELLERVGAAKVDAGFFTTLQAAPELGRAISTSDDQPGSDRVVVISHDLWRTMFGGRNDILGRTLRLDGDPYQIVGIMPADFGYPHKSDLAYGNGRIGTTQLWLPSALTPQQRADREGGAGFALARLRPGVTLHEAQAEMSSIISRLNVLQPPALRGRVALVKPFHDIALGPVRSLMWLLLGTVGFVLLIACGNAANLLLARAANRTHELGVRATLGARRGRLLRQMLTESLLLSAAAGLVGIGLAYLFLHALLRLDPGDIPRMADATLDTRVMAFLVLVTALTSILFGILPAFSATRINLAEFLNSGGIRGIAGDRRRVRNGLVIAQVALLVVLLTGAGLMLRSYINVLSINTGFSASTVVVNVPLGPQYNRLNAQYDSAQKRRALFGQLLDRIKPTRGVQSVAVVDYIPLSSSMNLMRLEVEGYANGKNQLAETHAVTPDYLSTMQISLLKGRDFTDDDGPGHPSVAIVNQAFAKKYFAGNDPISHHVRGSPTDPWTTIVGLIADARNMNLEEAAPPQIYFSFWQRDSNEAPASGAYIAVRSFLSQDVVVSEIRTAVRSIDANLAVADVHPMSDLVSRATARRRFQTTLLTLFSGMAMFLAVVGVYGLLAYSVSQRLGEIGIRMALGSSRTRVASLVLLQGLKLLGIGLLLGLTAATACTRLLASFLFGVPAVDPLTFSLVPVLLFVATLAACIIPSLRAAAVNPMNALRHE